jgi:hypothetical protein
MRNWAFSTNSTARPHKLARRPPRVAACRHAPSMSERLLASPTSWPLTETSRSTRRPVLISLYLRNVLGSAADGRSAGNGSPITRRSAGGRDPPKG